MGKKQSRLWLVPRINDYWITIANYSTTFRRYWKVLWHTMWKFLNKKRRNTFEIVQSLSQNFPVPPKCSRVVRSHSVVVEPRLFEYPSKTVNSRFFELQFLQITRFLKLAFESKDPRIESSSNYLPQHHLGPTQSNLTTFLSIFWKIYRIPWVSLGGIQSSLLMIASKKTLNWVKCLSSPNTMIWVLQFNYSYLDHPINIIFS